MLGHNDECMEDIPQWYFYNFDIDSEDASFAIKCNGKFFHIDVLAKDLGDWSGKEEFLRLIQDASDDYDAEKSLYELISDPCVLLLRTYAPSAEDTNPFNLQKYYSPETFVFKLIGNGNDIKAVRCPDDYARTATLLPQIAFSKVPDYSKVPYLDASTIRIIPREGPLADVTLDNPSVVSTDDTSTCYHFKAVQDPHSFLREFGILLQLREKRLNKKYRLPTIHGLVYYSDKPDYILGMLLNRIDNEDTLANWIERRNPPRSLKEKWNRQIKDTVRALHRHGIVWGDVKPDNVLIDREQNSWLIDFGGGFNSGYVDEDVVETIEGDIQGVSRMEETLLQGQRFPVCVDASFDQHD